MRNWNPPRLADALRCWPGLAATGIAVAIAVSGCRAEKALMPLEPGQRKTYSVRTRYVTYVDTMRVVGPVSIDGTTGVDVVGRMGFVRIGWRRNELIAERLHGTRADPPIVLAVAGSEGAEREWNGTVVVNGQSRSIQGRLVQQPERVQVGTRTLPGVRSEVTLRPAGGPPIVLTSWFVPGRGLVRQEQRTGGELDFRLDLVR